MKRRALTTRERSALALVLLAAMAASLSLSWRALHRARSEAADAASRHAAVIASVRRLEALRAQRSVVDDRPRPEPDLVARLQAQLHAVGLDPLALARISMQAPRPPAADSPYRTQAASITIERISPPDLARFLVAWRDAEPLWLARAIRLEHAPSKDASADAERFTAHLTLESAHVAPAGGQDPTTTTPGHTS